MNSVLFPLDPGRRQQEPPSGLPLVVVPHAGGTAHAFRGWTTPARTRGLEVFGTRTVTPAAGSPAPSVRDRAHRLAQSLAELGEPFVLVGHSLGGLIAAEAVLHLERHHPHAVPALLVVCATNPPQLHRPMPVPNGTEAEAVDFLRGAGGTPAAVLEDRGMRELAVAMLLGDLASLRGFAWDGRRLTTPTAVYAGRTDPLAPPESLARWTGAAESVTTRDFDSGHFFPHDRTAEVLDAIRLDLAGRDAPRGIGRPHHAHRP
ncbi:thioesterase II family protein [Streptomyces purpurascens]|uniref:Alpha/beta fold hydrolase n=1 Tax=Streptomyces purpurascens TaxID=1924 RepID=A0ABZ1MXW0_STREF|nr:alpha/beta fold hydrolase [Streptomyces purpurascens]MCE7049683.1 alpha/beta fold hydrolase [Streptomyces purpurascens]GHA44095.1 putative thioesterase [Streptomyces purpurascens]